MNLQDPESKEANLQDLLNAGVMGSLEHLGDTSLRLADSVSTWMYYTRGVKHSGGGRRVEMLDCADDAAKPPRSPVPRNPRSDMPLRRGPNYLHY